MPTLFFGQKYLKKINLIQKLQILRIKFGQRKFVTKVLRFLILQNLQFFIFMAYINMKLDPEGPKLLIK